MGGHVAGRLHNHCDHVLALSLQHLKQQKMCHLPLIYVERFSNECRKTKTKVVTQTNHNRNKRQNDQPEIKANLSK